MYRKILVVAASVATLAAFGGAGTTLMAQAGQNATQVAVAPETQAVTDTVLALADAGVSDAAPAVAGTFMLSMTQDGAGMTVFYTDGSASAQHIVDGVASVQGETPLPVTAQPVTVDFASIDSLARALSDPSSDLSESLGMHEQGSVVVEQTTGEVTVQFGAEADYPDSAVEHPDGSWTLNVEGVDVALEVVAE